jgi:hypothetical protein
MNIQKIVLGICLCFVTPGYAQLGVIAQTKRIQVVPQPVAQVDRPGTFIPVSYKHITLPTNYTVYL